jgi:alkylation response protein AidB-like acyl-CoA dehydrogenase
MRAPTGAHSNLCVNQIQRNGSAEQKARYLPKLVVIEALTPSSFFISERVPK